MSFFTLFSAILLTSCTSMIDEPIYQDSHENIMVEYYDKLDFNQLFQFENEITEVATKYSVLYKNDNMRHMYVFSVPVREYVNEEYSLIDHSIYKKNDTEYSTKNNQFNIAINETSIGIQYDSDKISVPLEVNTEISDSELLNNTLTFTNDQYEFEITPSYGGIVLNYLIHDKETEDLSIPINIYNYTFKNEKAGYSLIKDKKDDDDVFIINQAVIRDNNDVIYPNNMVTIENINGEHVIVAQIPKNEELIYPIKVEFAIDYNVDTMFFDASAYEAQPSINTIYNNLSIYDSTLSQNEAYTYMKFNIKSFIPHNIDLLDNVYLYVYSQYCIPGTIIEIYSIREDWCAWTLTWKKHPNSKEKLGEFELTDAGWYCLDITDYAKRLITDDFYNHDDNSIMFKIKDNINGSAIISSSDNKTTPPFFEVYYRK